MASRTQEKLIAAGRERFHVLGYNGCGVQEIADAAGVPKGSFYSWFKSKEHLALAVLDDYATRLAPEILLDRQLSPGQRLRCHFEFIATQHRAWGYRKGCLAVILAAETSDATPLLRDALRLRFAIWTAAVADAVREGQADGSIAMAMDADRMAQFLINSWSGALVRMKLDDSGRPLDDFLLCASAILSRSASR